MAETKAQKAGRLRRDLRQSVTEADLVLFDAEAGEAIPATREMRLAQLEANLRHARKALARHGVSDDRDIDVAADEIRAELGTR